MKRFLIKGRPRRTAHTGLPISLIINVIRAFLVIVILNTTYRRTSATLCGVAFGVAGGFAGRSAVATWLLLAPPSVTGGAALRLTLDPPASGTATLALLFATSRTPGFNRVITITVTAIATTTIANASAGLSR